ncbi:MAG: hypothetical protein HY794_00395 [Desulfarculus sp.]|nr:hypothetical protein [Desulfarculus sp.]
MPQAQPNPATMGEPRQRVRVSLEQIITCLQERTQNDQAVVAAVVELMRQGRLRRLASQPAARVDKAA